MAKEYFVLRAGKVIYVPGFYEEETAERFAKMESKKHPKAEYKVVQLVSTWQGVPANAKIESQD